MAICNEPPMTITSGYPEKLFRFAGWELVETGHRRIARRNRKTVLVPVYQADDGEKILMATYSKRVKQSRKP